MTSGQVAGPSSGAAIAARTLACLGDSGDIRAWSNIPYYLFQAASKAGFLTHTADLIDPAYRRRRLLWLLAAPLRLERPAGYQYSRASARRMWERLPVELRHGEILSHFQLFPPLELARAAGVQHSFYVDTTLRPLFDAGESERIGRRTLGDALQREGELYRSARFFIGMARATVESAVRDYGVDPAQAFTVKPGANLDETAVRAFLAARGPSWRERGEPFSKDRPARLGFIGMDWRRKGLARLVDAAGILARRGRPVMVSVIGNCPEHLRGHPQVEWLGVLSKSSDTAAFLAAVDSFALGCLPSHAEPLGISTLECLRLGVPVMGADVGGIPDCVPQDAGFLVPAAATGETIADEIERRLFAPDRYDQMQKAATREMENVTWDATVRRLKEIWAGETNLKPV
jgi:glycosyltransferase involved in cell wall biosynthesis